MRLSVKDAETFGKALLENASKARAAGQSDFDLTASMQQLDDAARSELVNAINAAHQSPGN